MSRRLFLQSSAIIAFVMITSVVRGEPGSAPNSPARADASASFREAQAAFARRDFAAAAAAFELAARAAPHSATWLNAAESWAKRDDWPRAAEDCDRALEVPNSDADVRHEAESRLRAALAHVATIDARGPRTTGARIDGGAVDPLPVRRRVAPGPHEIVLVDFASGREEPHLVTLVAGQSKTFDAPAGAAPQTPAAPVTRAVEEPVRQGPPLPAWIAFGVGGAAALGTTALGFVTLGDKRAFEDAPTQDALDRFHRDRVLTNVFLGAAVVAVAAGVALWMLTPPRGGLVRLRRDGFVVAF